MHIEPADSRYNRRAIICVASQYDSTLIFKGWTPFLLQYLELIYLVYKDYWVYALINALFTWAYTISLLRTLLSHGSKTVRLMNGPRLVPLVQAGWVRAAGSHRLVPGDIMVLQRGRAPCDMVILQGSCLVEESMLSGEVAHNSTMLLHGVAHRVGT